MIRKALQRNDGANLHIYTAIRFDSVEKISNILLDFGNVILDLDMQAGRQGMHALLQQPYDPYNQDVPEVFRAYETGEVSEADLVTALSHLSGREITPEDFRPAWNALIGEIPAHRTALLRQLRKRYRVYLFSNTNETHLDHLAAKYGSAWMQQFEQDCFDRVFYSCRIGLRKPDVAAFRHVLAEIGSDGTDTVFIDDGRMHIEGARAAGIRAHWHDPATELADTLQTLGLL